MTQPIALPSSQGGAEGSRGGESSRKAEEPCLLQARPVHFCGVSQ